MQDPHCTSDTSGKKIGINSARKRKGNGVWKQNKTRLPLNNTEDSQKRKNDKFLFTLNFMVECAF